MAKRKDGRYDTIAINGRTVRALRESRGLTQEELATEIGRTRGYLSVIESGHQPRVSRTTAEGLAAALGVDLSDLLAPADAPDLAHPAILLRNLPSVGDQWSLGEHLADLMAATHLSEDERRLVAEHLMAHTTAIIDIVVAARQLARR